ncbi:hypothetical protein NOVO_01860 [Rickettsiales bacterium Ac37b]|nr:hypothetical protein NOVO_01860 [Rickettsiales bacterium Ac37b]
MARTGKLKQAIRENIQIIPQSHTVIKTTTTGNVDSPIIKQLLEGFPDIHLSHEKKAIETFVVIETPTVPDYNLSSENTPNNGNNSVTDENTINIVGADANSGWMAFIHKWSL